MATNDGTRESVSAFEDLREYYRGFQLIAKPSELAEFTESHGVLSGLVVKCIISSTVLAATVEQLFERIVGVESDVSIFSLTGIGVIDEVAVIAVFIAGGFVSALLVQPGLRLLGGRAPLRRTLVCLVLCSVVCSPLLTVVEGLYAVAHAPVPGAVYAVPQVVIAAPALAAMHGISRGKATAALVGANMVVAMGVIAIIVMAM